MGSVYSEMRHDISRDIYAKNGVPLKGGETMKRPLYADTLQKIADNPMDFYTGDLAQDIVDDIWERGIYTTHTGRTLS